MAAGDIKQIGQYEIKEVLGRGGMATVYRGYQPSLDRDVAIKVMSSQFTDDPNFLERFKREARAIGSLRHPNILAVYDFGQDGATPYIVTELVEGKTLRERMGNIFEPKEAARLIKPLASALDYAHQRGIVHRDVKPTNILMGDHDRPVLSDFGIARLMQESSNITGTGMSIGTPHYMSPEQSTGEQLDGRSDQYSLAVILYEMLAGVPPFTADTPLSIIMGKINKPLPDPRQFNAKLPPAVVEVLKKALAVKPDNRYKTTMEFAEAYEKAAESQAAPVVNSYDPTLMQPAISPQQIYDMVTTQERAGNYQKAFDTLVDLQNKFPNFADVPQKVQRYQQMNYRYSGPTGNTTNVPSAAPTQFGNAPVTQQGPYAPITGNSPISYTAQTEMRNINSYPPLTGQYPAKPKSKLPLIFGIVGTLAFAAIATLVIVLVSGGNKPDPTKVAATTTTATTAATTTTATTTSVSTTTAPVTTKATTTVAPTTTAGVNDPAASQVQAATSKLYNGQSDFKTTATNLRNLIKQFPNSWLANRELGVMLYLWNIEGGEVDALKRAIELNEKDARSHAYLAMSYHDGYQFDKSLAESTRAIELDPNDADARAAYSMTLSVAGGDDKRVKDEAAKALALNPDGLWPRWASYLAAGDNDEGLVHIDFLIKKFPNMATFYNAKADTYRVNDDYDNAKKLYEQALAIEPKYPYSHAGLGWIYYDDAQYNEAEKEFRAAIQTNDSYDRGHIGLGYTLNAKGGYDEAIDHLKRAIQINNRSADGYNGLAYAYLVKGDNTTDTNARNQFYTLGLENADNALKYLPNHVDGGFNKGRALYSLKRYADAEPYLKKAVDDSPTTSVYRLTLAYNYYAQKRYAEAKTQAEEILKNNPNYKSATQLLEDIKKVTG